MNLDTIATEETHFDEPQWCTLYNPKGEPEKDSLGNTTRIQYVSEFAEPVRAIERVHSLRISALARQFGGMEGIPQSEWDLMRIEKTAASIVGLEGFESNAGPYKYSAAAAVALVKGLQEKRPKQLRQLEGAIQAHASFFVEKPVD